MSLSLSTEVSDISKVGKTIAGRLKKLGILNVEDLIFYYPFRYQDFSQVSKISELNPAESLATIKGKIEIIENRRSWKTRKTLTEGLVSDGSGSIKVIWFNQPFLTQLLKTGDEIYLSGKINFDRYGPQLVNPIHEKAKSETIHTARIVPIYPLTDRLTQKQIRWLIKVSLSVVGQFKDWLPESIKQSLKLYPLSQALNTIHFPSDQNSLDKAIERLKFDELFLFLLQSQLIKKELKSAKAHPINFLEESTKEFVDSLPFSLTNDQKKASWQILQDLLKSQPMNRLLEGEVGSGKTVVAAVSILNTILNKYQGVLMAPTEILADQHFKKIVDLFSLSKIKNQPQINIALLTRSNQRIGTELSTKGEILKKIKSGEIDLLISTHSVIQPGVEFKN